MFAVQTYAALRRFIFVEGKSRREAARVFGLGRETIAKMRRYSAPLGTYGQKKRPFTDRRPCADRPKDGYRLQLWSKPVRYNPRIEPGHKPAHKGLAEANGEDQEQAVGSANRLPSTVDTNSRRWVSCFTLGGKIHEMGLGAFPTVCVADARRARDSAVARVMAGLDPIIARVDAIKARAGKPTFGEAADAYIGAKAAEWRNPKHRAQWRMTLEEYAKPFSRISPWTKLTRQPSSPSCSPYGSKSRKPHRGCANGSNPCSTRRRRRVIDRARTLRAGAATSTSSCRSARCLRAAIMPPCPM